MRKQPTESPGDRGGRPRKVNQVLLDRMMELRKQGFSCKEIAQKVQRSERTVRRYTRGIGAQLAVSPKPKPVDVLAACGKVIVYGRERLGLNTEEMDFLFKRLRETFESRDPLTREWLANDSKARTEFLFKEVLRPGMSEIKFKRWIEQFRLQVGDDGMIDEGDVEGRSSPDRLLQG